MQLISNHIDHGCLTPHCFLSFDKNSFTTAQFKTFDFFQKHLKARYEEVYAIFCK